MPQSLFKPVLSKQFLRSLDFDIIVSLEHKLWILLFHALNVEILQYSVDTDEDMQRFLIDL